MHLVRDKQEYFDSDYQGATVNSFSVKEEITASDEAIIGFVNSDYFKIDCVRDYIKQKSRQERDLYLKPAFMLEEISIEDFKKLNLKQLYSYFDAYINGEWGDDKQDFIVVWSKLKKLLSELGGTYTFYLLSKEWFEESNQNGVDRKLREPEIFTYTYYFLLIGISTEEQKLVSIELFYD
jgi:hypothetical protein